MRGAAGHVSEYTGAAALLGRLMATQSPIADLAHGAELFRDALTDKGIRPCIPGLKSRGKAVRHDSRRYKPRNHIEIMFGSLKEWRCIATS
jgi:hypothetical protein